MKRISKSKRTERQRKNNKIEEISKTLTGDALIVQEILNPYLLSDNQITDIFQKNNIDSEFLSESNYYNVPLGTTLGTNQDNKHSNGYLKINITDTHQIKNYANRFSHIIEYLNDNKINLSPILDIKIKTLNYELINVRREKLVNCPLIVKKTKKLKVLELVQNNEKYFLDDEKELLTKELEIYSFIVLPYNKILEDTLLELLIKKNSKINNKVDYAEIEKLYLSKSYNFLEHIDIENNSFNKSNINDPIILTISSVKDNNSTLNKDIKEVQSVNAKDNNAGKKTTLDSIKAHKFIIQEHNICKNINDFLVAIKDKNLGLNLLEKTLALKYTQGTIKGYLNNAFIKYQKEIKVQNRVKINKDININQYEQDFQTARSIKRKFTFLVGPTNSGKTHSAFNELLKGNSGVYLAPLRLLALEGQEIINNNGFNCDLITGEEKNIQNNSSFVSSTIEMCNYDKFVDSAVIDEIQMITDKDRGWAWTNAICGIAAHNVYLVGSELAISVIIPLLKRLGEEYEIKYFERKNSIKKMNRPIDNLNHLTKGDALIAFSRKDIINYKNMLEKLGKKVSVVYGSLTPEVRKIEARKFRDGETDILVSTDAIGMGLNLPIKRIIFSKTEKFDGVTNRALNEMELKQIGGRAGRYGMHEIGYVGAMDFDSIEYLNHNFNENDKFTNTIYDTSLLISPTISHVEKIAKVLKTENIFDIFNYFKSEIKTKKEMYKISDIDSMLTIAQHLESITKHYENRKDTYAITLAEKFKYCCTPINSRDKRFKSDDVVPFNIFLGWMKIHVRDKSGIVNYPNFDEKRLSLENLEEYAKILGVYKWLSYKFNNIYIENIEATHKLISTNVEIEEKLGKTKNKVELKVSGWKHRY